MPSSALHLFNLVTLVPLLLSDSFNASFSQTGPSRSFEFLSLPFIMFAQSLKRPRDDDIELPDANDFKVCLTQSMSTSHRVASRLTAYVLAFTLPLADQ